MCEISDVFIDEANHIYSAIPMYNLIEYSDNYSNTSGTLWQFKRDEVPANNADLTDTNSDSFKYQAALVGKTANNTNSSVKNKKISVPLKYLSNFWRSLKMPLINCKIHLELNRIEDFAKFKIKDAKLRISIVTLSTKDNVNLTKQLSNGFKRSVFWSNYQTVPANVINNGTKIYELLSAKLQGVKRLLVLAYIIDAGAANNEAGIKTNKKYFLPRGEFENYNFYDQPVNDLMKQYDEVRKVSTGQGDDYTTGCLLDYAYFKDN